MNCLSQKLSPKSGDFKKRKRETLPDLHQVILEDKKLKGGTGISSGLLIASTPVFSRRQWCGGEGGENLKSMSVRSVEWRLCLKSNRLRHLSSSFLPPLLMRLPEKSYQQIS